MPTFTERNGRFMATVRIKRKGIIAFQQSATFDTLTQAKKWGYALESCLSKEGVESFKSKTTLLVNVLLAYSAYRESIRPLGRGTQHSLRELMQSPFGAKSVNALIAKDLVDWGTVRAKTIKPSTVMHHFMILRSALQSASSLLGIKADLEPIKDAMDTLRRSRLISRSESRERRISDSELDQITMHLRGKALLVPTDIYVRLAVALPRRREELLTMLWADYDGNTIFLRDTKNPSRVRNERVPVPPKAKIIIDALPRFEGEPRILPYKPESVSAAFQRTVREIGLSDIRLHDLRHEGISRLFEAGLQIQEVSLISGHTSWAALRRYTHISPYDVLEKLKQAR